MFSCWCTIDVQIHAALAATDCLGSIHDLYRIVAKYASPHGTIQPYQTADDDPLDADLMFDETNLTTTLDSFEHHLQYKVPGFHGPRQQVIRTWGIYKFPPATIIRIAQLDGTEFPRQVILNQIASDQHEYYLTVLLVDEDPRHFPLQPMNDAKQITRILKRYGSGELKSKLCPYIKATKTSKEAQEETHKRADSNTTTFGPLPELNIRANIPGETFEAALTRLRAELLPITAPEERTHH